MFSTLSIQSKSLTIQDINDTNRNRITTIGYNIVIIIRNNLDTLDNTKLQLQQRQQLQQLQSEFLIFSIKRKTIEIIANINIQYQKNHVIVNKLLSIHKQLILVSFSSFSYPFL